MRLLVKERVNQILEEILSISDLTRSKVKTKTPLDKTNLQHLRPPSL